MVGEESRSVAEAALPAAGVLGQARNGLGGRLLTAEHYMAMGPERLVAPSEEGCSGSVETWSAEVRTSELLTMRASPSRDRLQVGNPSFGEAADLWAEAQRAASVARLHEGAQPVQVVLVVAGKVRAG